MKLDATSRKFPASPEVLAFFKAGGAGWQTRMDEALKQWVASHGPGHKR